MAEEQKAGALYDHIMRRFKDSVDEWEWAMDNADFAVTVSDRQTYATGYRQGYMAAVHDVGLTEQEVLHRLVGRQTAGSSGW